MSPTASPRVLYCGAEDSYFKKLSKHASGFFMEARSIAFTGSPQSVARARRASALVLKIKNDIDLKHQEWLSRSDSSVPVIVICQNGTLETAVSILQYGVFDYFSSSQSLTAICKRIADAVVRKDGKAAKRRTTIPEGLLHGKHPDIMRINEQARRLAREPGRPVLIYGEPGTGKEHLAYGMYRISFPGDVPFIRYDCRLLHQIAKYDGVTVSKLVQSGIQEIWKRHRKGVLFLNHLEQMNPDQQRDILDAGSDSSIRLIASYQEPFSAANRQSVPQSTLRLPALRQHADDIPTLAEHFIRRTAGEKRIKLKVVSGEMLTLMREYPWPGNVQELSNVVERMMLIEPSGILTSHSWNNSHGYGVRLNHDRTQHFSALVEKVLQDYEAGRQRGALYDVFMERMKRLLIDLILPKVDFNQATAAKVLGISRNTLREIIRQTTKE